MPADKLVLRPAEPVDEAQILALGTRTLGWGPEPRWGALFRWKHQRNPFGPSPAWVAVDGSRVVGFRVFLRWQFLDASGRVHHGVRAVDTATDPDFQGRGIFTRLTLAALDDLAADGGLGFVFNTPNDKSRRGYLKMGWQVVGRPPVMVAPTGLRRLTRLAGARTAADLWSEPCGAGRDARDVLATSDAERLVARLEPAAGLATHRTTAFLRWRYGLPELRYRAVTLTADTEEGLALFRVRRRGTALEATVGDILVPESRSSGRRQRALLRRIARTSGADYVIVAAQRSLIPTPALPARGLGPTLTWRAVGEPDCPPLASWRLTLGDLELF